LNEKEGCKNVTQQKKEERMNMDKNRPVNKTLFSLLFILTLNKETV